MLHIIYSNRYEALKECLIANLNQERLKNDDPIFSPLRVIVPGDAVTADLNRAIADHTDSGGICTGIKMQQISRWMEPYGSLWLGNSDLGIELEWVIWQILQDDDFINKPQNERLANYLTKHQKEGQKSASYELAIRIAKVFTKYINYRYDWVLEWLLGDDVLLEKKIILDSNWRKKEIELRNELPDAGWQAALWQEIKHRLTKKSEANSPDSKTLIDLLEGIPEKFEQNRADKNGEKAFDSLHFFLPKTLPPMALPFLAEEARKRDLWLYLMNPCCNFWFESIPPQLFDWTNSNGKQIDNRLLHRSGASTRALIDRIWHFAPDDGEIPLIEEEKQNKSGWTGTPVTRCEINRGGKIDWGNLAKATYKDFSDAREKGGNVWQGIDQYMFYIERKGETLLDKIADSVLNDTPLNPSPEKDSNFFNPTTDLSLRIVKASGFVRQVEAVADWIHAIRKDLKDKNVTDLKADDILVVTPDIDTAAPLIEGVMDALPDGAKIAYSIVGRNGLVSNMAAQGVIKAGKMLHSNMGAETFFALLAHPLMTASWNITLDDVQVMRRWLETAGFRYGLNQEHLDALEKDGKVQKEVGGSDGTLSRAIERLVLGHMTAEGMYQPYGDVLPVYGTENTGFNRISDESGRRLEVLVNIFTAFENAFGSMVTAETRDETGKSISHGADAFQDKEADSWYKWTLDLIDQLFPNTPSRKSYAENIAEFRQTLAKQVSLIRLSLERNEETKPKLSFGVFWHSLENSLVENRDNIRGSGRVIFAGMQDFRWLPYRAIAMIGMDDGPVFPGVNRGEEFDLTLPIGVSRDKIIRRRGDRDSRSDNRNIFLDLLLAAQDYLLITYNAGTNPESKSPLNPSIVVQDLISFLEGAGIKREQIETVLPLTRYSEGNLIPDEKGVRFFRTFDKRVKTAVINANTMGYQAKEPSFFEGAKPIGELLDGTVLPFADLEGFWAKPDTYLRRKLKMADTENIEQSRIVQVSMPDDGLFRYSTEKRMMEMFEQHDELEKQRAEIDKLQLDPRFGCQEIRNLRIGPIAEKIMDIHDEAKRLIADNDTVLESSVVEVMLENKMVKLQIPALQTCRGTDNQNGYLVVALTGSASRRALILHLLVSASNNRKPLYIVHWDKNDGVKVGRYQPYAQDEARKILVAMCQLYQMAMKSVPVFPDKFEERPGGISKSKFNPIWRHDESLQGSQNQQKKKLNEMIETQIFEMEDLTEKKSDQGKKKTKKTKKVTADKLVELIHELMNAAEKREAENE